MNPVHALNLQVNEKNEGTKRIIDQVFTHGNGSSYIIPFVRDMAKNGLEVAWLVKPGTLIKPYKMKVGHYSDFADLLAVNTLEVY